MSPVDPPVSASLELGIQTCPPCPTFTWVLRLKLSPMLVQQILDWLTDWLTDWLNHLLVHKPILCNFWIAMFLGVMFFFVLFVCFGKRRSHVWLISWSIQQPSEDMSDWMIKQTLDWICQYFPKHILILNISATLPRTVTDLDWTLP